MEAVAPRIDLNIADSIALAAECFSAGRFEDARRIFMAAATAGGGFHAINGLAMALSELGRPGEALPLFDQGYGVLRDEMMALMANRAKALMDLGRTEEALEIYDGMVQSNPRVLFLRYSRGLALLQMARHEEAIAEFDFVLERDPENDLARFGRGFANLVLGNYGQGFKDYECRLKDDIEVPSAPLWTGAESLAGKTILVHGEQGHGDDIMFMRYVPRMLERGAKVLLVLHPGVRPLFEGLLPGTTCLSDDRSTWPKFDYWVRMMSLALAFGTTVDTVPPPAPIKTQRTSGSLQWAVPTRRRYLYSEELLREKPLLHVGICWAGSPKSRYDSHRSIPLEQLLPLFAMPGVKFHGLMQDVRDSDLPAFKEALDKSAVDRGLVDYGGFADFRDTAELIEELDHVVTVDTSVAHLAGTVGTPTTVLLTAFRTYWLWIKGIESTPWYPNMHCIRQERDGDWAPVVDRVRAKLFNRRAA